MHHVTTEDIYHRARDLAAFQARHAPRYRRKALRAFLRGLRVWLPRIDWRTP